MYKLYCTRFEAYLASADLRLLPVRHMRFECRLRRLRGVIERAHSITQVHSSCVASCERRRSMLDSLRMAPQQS